MTRATNEIVLYGTVGGSGWWDEGEFFTAATVREALDGKTGPLTVRINSGGGIASEGHAIYTMLRDYAAEKGEVHTVNDAVAMSAASLIFMAGDRRTMRLGSYLLIHDPATPWSEGRGTEEDHRKTADMLQVVSNAYAEIYALRSGSSRADARAVMQAETILDSEAAVLMSFATDTEATQAVEASVFDYRIYAHAPRDLRERSKSLGRARGDGAVLAMIAGFPRPKPKEPVMADGSMNTTTAEASASEDTPPMGPTQRERMRAKRIRDLGMKANMPLVDINKLVDDGTPLEMALDKINAAWVADGGEDIPMFGAPVSSQGRSYDGGERFRAKMTAGLSARLAGKADSPMAREAAQVSLPDLVMACARNAGLRPGNVAQAVRMRGLWTTSDFPKILDASLGNEIGREIAAAEIPIQRAARVTESPDYRLRKLLQASRTTMPMEVPEGAEIKAVQLTESGENSVQIRDFAGMYGITLQAFVNDGAGLGLLQDMKRRMASGAMERKRVVLLEPVLAAGGLGETMSDGKAYFHLDHGNLAAVPSALSVASIGAGVTSMARLRGPFGEPLAVTPRFLVVPPELQFVAAQVLATVAATTTNDVNPLSGSLEIIVEPGLTNTTAWYLVADPAVYDGLVLGFLEGQTQPRVESKEGWDVLSIEWRVWWPLDAALTSTASWYRNAGV